MPSERSIKVPCNVAQYEALQRAAAFVGLPLTAYLRTCGLERARAQEALQGGGMVAAVRRAVGEVTGEGKAS